MTQPKLIYSEIEKLMKEDWEQSSSMPGVGSLPTTARGWLEHRSRIGPYAGSIRPAWIMAGAWDDLMSGHYDRARARLALGVAAYDQQSYDRGAWTLAGEISLESHPPYSAFGNHAVPDPSESHHTRLIDSRWVDLFMSRLRSLADFQEKKSRLGPQRLREPNSQRQNQLPQRRQPSQEKGQESKRKRERARRAPRPRRRPPRGR